MKRKIITLAAGIICLATLATGTLAYFTTEKQVHNVITSGAVDIQIEEWQDPDGDGKDYLPYPDAPIEVMPGTTVSKIVNVKNLEQDAYIRAQFDIIITKPDGNVMDISPEALEKVISVKMDGNHWVRKNGDSEWWYYNEAVQAGDTTEAFFTEVVFDGPNMTNEYQNCTVEVIVNAQGVQAANNGTSAVDAAGWPAE